MYFDFPSPKSGMSPKITRSLGILTSTALSLRMIFGRSPFGPSPIKYPKTSNDTLKD